MKSGWMKLFIAVFVPALALINCDQFPEGDTLGEGFTLVLLQDNQKNVPLNAELQVWLGGQVSPEEFMNLAAVLVDELTGEEVLGDVDKKLESLILAFIPLNPLQPESDYTLIVTSPSGATFTYHFTTASGIRVNPPPGSTPPQVTITSPGAGAVVSGLIKVTATATDDLGLFGNLTAWLEGLATGGWRVQPPATAAFFINTVTVANGPRLVEVKVMDVEGNLGAGSVSLNVANGSPSSTPFWIYEDSLDLARGITGSAALDAALTPVVTIWLLALTDDPASYQNWENLDRTVGIYSVDGYEPNEDPVEPFTSPGVACLRLFSRVNPTLNWPACTLTLVLPDHSTLKVYLPHEDIDQWDQVAYYIAADGSTHYAHSAHGPVAVDEAPDLSPSTALSQPAAAGP